MNRRPHLTLVALIVAGLIGVALLAAPGSPLEQKPTLGLDLQGGLEVTLQAVPPPNRPLQKSDLSRSVEILRDRVDRLGVAEPEIREQGSDQISIQLPGVKNPEDVIDILGKTAQLELYDLEANLVGPRSASRTSRSRRRRSTRCSPASRPSSRRARASRGTSSTPTRRKLPVR